MACPSAPVGSCPPSVVGHGAGRLGGIPNSADLPSLPSFTPSGGPATTPLDILAEAALVPTAPSTPDLTASSEFGKALHSAGPYNPAATLPPKVVRKIMSLEFVEMRSDIWPDESVVPETIQSPRRSGKPPVTSIRSWLECYGCMAAILSMLFPEKAAELWAYQTTIMHAANAMKGRTGWHTTASTEERCWQRRT